MIRDRLRRGFIILQLNVNKLEIDLDFAFVDVKHRRKNVVRNLFEVIKRKYPGTIVSLEAREEALPVWKKLGFQEYDGQTHFLWYEIPLKKN
jgi:RNase P/RNase MRP subunit p30